MWKDSRRIDNGSKRAGRHSKAPPNGHKGGRAGSCGSGGRQPSGRQRGFPGGAAALTAWRVWAQIPEPLPPRYAAAPAPPLPPSPAPDAPQPAAASADDWEAPTQPAWAAQQPPPVNAAAPKQQQQQWAQPQQQPTQVQPRQQSRQQLQTPSSQAVSRSAPEQAAGSTAGQPLSGMAAPLPTVDRRQQQAVAAALAAGPRPAPRRSGPLLHSTQRGRFQRQPSDPVPLLTPAPRQSSGSGGRTSSGSGGAARPWANPAFASSAAAAPSPPAQRPTAPPPQPQQPLRVSDVTGVGRSARLPPTLARTMDASDPEFRRGDGAKAAVRAVGQPAAARPAPEPATARLQAADQLHSAAQPPAPAPEAAPAAVAAAAATKPTPARADSGNGSEAAHGSQPAAAAPQPAQAQDQPDEQQQRPEASGVQNPIPLRIPKPSEEWFWPSGTFKRRDE